MFMLLLYYIIYECFLLLNMLRNTCLHKCIFNATSKVSFLVKSLQNIIEFSLLVIYPIDLDCFVQILNYVFEAKYCGK